MSSNETTTGFKPKKSVALSGQVAGNTALCTVGRSGNDLHYRGYDILDLAVGSEFEEVAHLLVHGKLPNKAELKAYKTKLKALRGLPAALKTALEQLPPSAHPMDVMRTGVSVLANITEFGSTPLFTTEELASADVSIALYPLSAFRAMNKAAENVYETLRKQGTQKNVVDTMQTRQELYERINYHAFEQYLDGTFAKSK